ncbi:MAG: beta-glucosidase, partial [Streptomycetaceae bacterium]|nr:beta-glucosidase [Streptomycetaceae bacterium]
GGAAIADILYGAVNPSGHLAESVPIRLQDNPSYLNFPGENGHVRYGEGVMVGYRYYNTVDLPVRYPFGHGLSYTAFETRDLTATLTGDDTASVSVTVTNTGTRAGKHVVQVYVATSAGPVRRPVRELRAFAKVSLEPGESRAVTLTLDRRAFAYYDTVYGDWVVAGGEYVVQIGRNAADVVAETTLTLVGDVLVQPLSHESPVGDWFAHPIVGPELITRLSAGMPPQDPEQAEENARLLRMVHSMPMSQFLAFTGVALTAEHLDVLLSLVAPSETD